MLYILKFIIYYIALIGMVVLFPLACTTDNKTLSVLCYVITYYASSYILFAKSFDWTIILALKRKKVDKALGIHTGIYFKILVFVSLCVYVTSFIKMIVNSYTYWTRIIIISFILISFSIVLNLYNAYISDPDEVISYINMLNDKYESNEEE